MPQNRWLYFQVVIPLFTRITVHLNRICPQWETSWPYFLLSLRFLGFHPATTWFISKSSCLNCIRWTLFENPWWIFQIYRLKSFSCFLIYYSISLRGVWEAVVISPWGVCGIWIGLICSLESFSWRIEIVNNEPLVFGITWWCIRRILFCVVLPLIVWSGLEQLAVYL